ncbi:MAG TPA: hypothetical protein VGR00_02595 [Thermoanaerobaculia bacterium]|nr:hypothetical protein [Thermoanaerobaculia bacterium]
MIAPFFFVAAAALGPAPCMLTFQPASAAGPNAAVSPAKSHLDEKVSLELKDANLLDTLEKVAELLGVTLIADPGVDGAVTLDVRDLPLRGVLERLQKEHGIAISVEKDRMLVRRSRGDSPRALPSAGASASAPPGAASNPPLPRRPTSEKPKSRFVAAVEVRSPDGASLVFSLGRGAAAMKAPGCAEDIFMTEFGSDPFDGRTQAIVRLMSEGKRKASRVVSLDPIGADPVFLGLGSCRLAFAETERRPEALESTANAVPRAQYMVSVELREVTETDEKDLSSPRVQTQEGSSFTVMGRDDIADGTLSIYQRGVVLQGSGGVVDLVLATTVLVDLKPNGTEVPMTVRTAQAQEWLKMTLGKTMRVMVSPTYGLGRSALVADVTVTKMEPRK